MDARKHPAVVEADRRVAELKGICIELDKNPEADAEERTEASEALFEAICDAAEKLARVELAVSEESWSKGRRDHEAAERARSTAANAAPPRGQAPASAAVDAYNDRYF